MEQLERRLEKRYASNKAQPRTEIKLLGHELSQRGLALEAFRMLNDFELDLDVQ